MPSVEVEVGVPSRGDIFGLCEREGGGRRRSKSGWQDEETFR